MKRSKLQTFDMLDWYKKRFPNKVKSKYLYLPEEIKQQERAQVIFFNLDKTKDNKLAIEKLYDICVKSGMSINRNQVRMLFEKIDADRSKCIDLEEFQKSVLNQEISEQFTQVAMKVRKNMNEGYLPIYYNQLISHLSYVSNREELKQQINDQYKTRQERFTKLKEMFKLKYEDIEEPENKQIQAAKKNLNELKQNYEGKKMDSDTHDFLTQMNNKVEFSKIKSDQDDSILPKRINSRKLSIFDSNDKNNSLPKIHNSEHIKWNKNLSLINLQVKDKLYNKSKQLLSPRSKKQQKLLELRSEATKYVKKAKKSYDIEFDTNIEHLQSLDEYQTGGRSFEEGILSLIQQQMQQPNLYNFTNISVIKNNNNDQDEPLEQSGDHLPKSILRKLQLYKNQTRDSTQILQDKSILSSQQSKISGIFTPYYYQNIIHQTNTNTDSLNSNELPTQQKKRAHSQQDLKYQTPHFKQQDFQLPYI